MSKRQREDYDSPLSPQAKIVRTLTLEERKAYIATYNFAFCQQMSKYEKVSKIGQGTFGEVFKARDRAASDNKFVAMKKVLMENQKEGFPMTAMREIKILKQMQHQNVVNLIEVCHTRGTADNGYRTACYMVFDFCEHDLAGLLSNADVKFGLGEIKSVMQQLLNAVFYIHTNKILHRDIKPANILITKEGVLKLADFGLARAFSAPMNDTKNCFTNRVVTLWYRPPELLLGERDYGPPVDMWSVGCIMAEMWTRLAIFQGNTEQLLITTISQFCGSFTPDVWPGIVDLPLYDLVALPKNHKRRVKQYLRPYVKDSHCRDLIDKLLTLDPKKRLDADTALNHDFFWVDPMPSDLSKMLAHHKGSMLTYEEQLRRNQTRNYHQRPKITTVTQKPQANSFADRVW